VGDSLGIPSATLSFHLKELKSAGLIDCERVGRSRIYRAAYARVDSLIGFLTENCCRGIDKKGRPRRPSSEES
jgi:DNA-binding transcriptional ArsR family regulator